MVLYTEGKIFSLIKIERIKIMKRFLSILLTAASLFAFTSCSERTELPFDEKQPYSQPPETEKVVWLEKDLDDDSEDDVNYRVTEGNTFSKDFDGALLTVTTDKAEYKLGEEIHFTASVKNNTEETIALYGPTTTKEAHEDITTWFGHDGMYLFDPDRSFIANCAVNRIKLAPGEEYVQNERRITFIHKSNYKFGEYFEFAPLGEYACSSSFCMYEDPEDSNSIGEYNTLDFSITITEPDEPVELYRLPPPEDNGQWTSHYHSDITFEAKTDKSNYRPGDTLTFKYHIENTTGGEIELTKGFSSVFPHDDYCSVYPWAAEDELIAKQPLPEGVKVEHDGEYTNTVSFVLPTEPGEYAVDFSADIRRSSGEVENFSLLFIGINVVNDDQ